MNFRSVSILKWDFINFHNAIENSVNKKCARYILLTLKRYSENIYYLCKFSCHKALFYVIMLIYGIPNHVLSSLSLAWLERLTVEMFPVLPVQPLKSADPLFKSGSGDHLLSILPPQTSHSPYSLNVEYNIVMIDAIIRTMPMKNSIVNEALIIL